MLGYEDKRSKYYYESCDVLVNKLDIKNAEELEAYERQVVALKLLIIDKTSFTDKFDKVRLMEIHRFLFNEVYDFAGEFREENLAKGDFRFASCEFITSELDRILEDLDNLEVFNELSISEIADKLAYIMSELNVVHPFREGNGRTYREFIRELADKLGYNLDWSRASYKEIFDASVKSVYDYEDLTKIIYDCLSVKE